MPHSYFDQQNFGDNGIGAVGYLDQLISAGFSTNNLNGIKKFADFDPANKSQLYKLICDAFGEDLYDRASYIVAIGGKEGHAFNVVVKDGYIHILDSKPRRVIKETIFKTNQITFYEQLRGYISSIASKDGIYTLNVYNVTNINDIVP